VQKKFEMCMCTRNHMEDAICSVDFSQCNIQCRGQYDETVPNLQCQEKDRKIDWSATKKIECYLDVLLHDYTEKELLEECGEITCVNKAREAAYKRCSTICLNVDHDGQWSSPTCSDDGGVTLDGHSHREEHDQYHLGDGKYACDANGHEVHTEHRGGKDRKEELRCTEHLDIDYQIPPCRPCAPPSGQVCDAQFHCTYYAHFDWVNDEEKWFLGSQKIGCISDCCPENGKGCFAEQKITTCADPEAYAQNKYASTQMMQFGEHSHAWAYNRCECMKCNAAIPVYPQAPPGEGKCTGVHTPGFGGSKDAY